MPKGIVKDVGVADLALIELARDGATKAPWWVLSELKANGYVRVNYKGVPVLTDAGKTRARKLDGAELHDPDGPPLRSYWSGRSQRVSQRPGEAPAGGGLG